VKGRFSFISCGFVFDKEGGYLYKADSFTSFNFMETLRKTCLLSLRELQEGNILRVWGISGQQKKSYHFLILKAGHDLRVRCVFPVESSLYGRSFVLTDDLYEGMPLLADLDRNVSYTAIIKKVEGMEVKPTDFLEKAGASSAVLQIRKFCQDAVGEIKKVWMGEE
jgi:hypothetical protein